MVSGRYITAGDSDNNLKKTDVGKLMKEACLGKVFGDTSR
jgi:hypothetical protein